MPQSNATFDPFWFVRWPFTGDVNQRITTPWFSPTVNVTYAGDAAIEDRVTADVASYGRQLGWLSEIIVALAHKQDAPERTLARLEQAMEDIENIKKQRQKSVRDRAIEALDRLKRDQPEEYERLLRERRRAED
jgi:hypothetical protein